MEFINPLGRSVGSGEQPMACACHEGYAGYRGNDDSCLHCGCVNILVRQSRPSGVA